jgi:hypothetical protein
MKVWILAHLNLDEIMQKFDTLPTRETCNLK